MFCWVSGIHVASYGDVAILLSFYTSQWSYCSCIVLLQALLQFYRHEDSYSCKGVVGCGVYAHTPLVLLQVYSRVALSIRSSGETETRLEKPQNNFLFSIETDLFSFSIYLSNILLRCYLSLLSRVRTVVEVTLTLPSNKALLLNTGLCLDLRWWGSHPREPCRIQEKCSTHGSVARRLRSGVARLFSHPFFFFFFSLVTDPAVGSVTGGFRFHRHMLWIMCQTFQSSMRY